jgi:hypothetical protein
MSDYNIHIDPESGRRGNQEADRIDSLRNAKKLEIFGMVSLLIGLCGCCASIGFAVYGSNDPTIQSSNALVSIGGIVFYLIACVAIIFIVFGAVSLLYSAYKNYIYEK